MAIPKLGGWVPLRVYQDREPFMIDWCYLGDRRFVEPFYDQTIGACLEHPFNLLFRQQTTAAVLVERNRQDPGLKPSGFIFHMSRSGSTLIARMLAALPQNIVISEASPINSILKLRFTSGQISEQQNVEWLQAMVGAMGQPRSGSEQHFFIKFEAWHVLMLHMIRKAFPNVPWIFTYRDPIDVLVSQMDHLGQIVPSALHYSLFGEDANSVVSMPPEEYSAIVLAAICNAALSNHQDGGMLINYSQLPDAVCSSISDFFGVHWTDEEMAAMMNITGRHSKTPDQTFRNDSQKKREKATDEVRQAAERWLDPMYELLEKSRIEAGPQH